ncbi:MAG: O-antigen ligase family protein [Patescibacteria group bacterium]|jgi:O-antigen ligase
MPDKNLINTIKFFLFLGLLVPLIVEGNTIFPFIFSKVIFFRIIVDIAVLLFLWTLWSKKNKRLTFHWPDILLLVFVLWAIISAFWGVDLQYSWWTGQERMSGLVSLLHFVAYLYLLVNVFSAKDWLYFFRGILAVGIIIFLKSINELNIGQQRASGPLGNPIYLGEYFLYLFWFAGLLFFINKNKIERWIMAIFLFLGIVGIFISGSRGPLMSLAVALVLYLLWNILHIKKLSIKLALVFFGISIATVIGMGIFTPQIGFIKNTPILNNLAEVKNFSGSLANRFIVSGIAWQSSLERPFGWGWENFPTAFSIHYKPELLKRGWGDSNFDSAHNLYLDILVGAGFVGLFLWLAFFAFIIFYIGRLYKKSANEKNKYILLMAFVLSILTQFFVAFLHPSGYLLLFILLAYIIFCIRQSDSKQFTIDSPKIIVKSLIIIFTLLTLIFVYQNFKAYSENKNQQKAYRNIAYQNYTEAENIIKASWGSWGPYERDILRNYTEYIEGIGLGNLPLELRSAYIQIVKDIALETEKNIDKYNKKSPTEYESMLRSYVMLWGAGDKNENKINETYQKLLAINDKNQAVNFTYFNYLAISGQWDKAIVLLDKVISDEPDIYYAYWYKAKIYLYLKDYQKAYDNYLLAKDRGFAPDGLADQNLVKLFEQLKASSTSQLK